MAIAVVVLVAPGTLLRSSGDAIPRPLTLAFLLFSLALLPKMVFSARVSGYGFVLVMPGMLFTLVALLDWLPATLRGSIGPCLH